MYQLSRLSVIWLTIISPAQAKNLAQQVKSLRGVPFQTMKQMIIDNAEATDDLGRDLFHYAAIFGNVPLVKFLLKHEINANLRDKEGKTPFDHALQGVEDENNVQQMSIISYLLEHQGGINARDEHGWTPLIWAMVSGNISRVERLLKNGAETRGTVDVLIRLQDERLWQLFWQHRRSEISGSIVYYARQLGRGNKDVIAFVQFMLTRKGDDEWVKGLLSRAYEVTSATGIDGMRALNMALSSQDQEVWQIYCDLVQHKIGRKLVGLTKSKFWQAKLRRQIRDDFIKFVVNNRTELKTNDKQKLLVMAIKLRQTSLVQFLIDNGTDIENVNLLPVAAKVGARNLVEILIANDVDIERADSDGRTALGVAAYYGYDNIVRLLLKKKAKIDAVDKRGKTAFMLAAYRGQLSTVQLLRDQGATIDALTDKGRDALAFAALAGHSRMVELLIKYGLKVTDKTLEYARLGGKDKIIRLLEES